jgi:hypothetical protein
MSKNKTATESKKTVENYFFKRSSLFEQGGGEEGCDEGPGDSHLHHTVLS